MKGSKVPDMSWKLEAQQMTAAITPFDKIAEQYDELWSNTAIGASQRHSVWRQVDSLFRSGDRVLDLGCGTGEDALHLTSRGVQVLGIDSSFAMVEIALRRGVNAYRLDAANLAYLNGEFDGALSNFGALNCVEHLEALCSALARLIRPGGYAVVCVMSPACVWEIFYFLLHVKFRKAFRRSTRRVVASSLGVAVRYPSKARLVRAFFPNFELICWYGIGLAVPPSYLCGFSQKMIRRLDAIDLALAHWPVLRGLADHRLLVFRRL